MYKIRVKDKNLEISAKEGQTLMQALLEGGVFVDNPCNGKGTCGKCKVRVLNSKASDLSETEKRILKKDEVEGYIRLSCLTPVDRDLDVELLVKERKHKVLTGGFMPDFKRDFKESGYGICVDIGTTTVAMGLVDLRTGKEIANSSMINSQKKFGQDVLTRITYEYENGEKAIEELQTSIVRSSNAMIDEMLEETGVNREEVQEIVFAANTTMAHMLLGVDARSLGKFPYKPEFIDSVTKNAKGIGLKLPKASLYVLPHVSAFIGADIVAGAYVCSMQEGDKNVLFIDIGTNGEIVLRANGVLYSCSCAAGPALEGMNISSGMRASEGAIEDIFIKETGIELKTIGGEDPVGLCGSGILAVVKELLKVGLVKKTGAFIKKEKLSEDDYRSSMLRLNGNKREFLIKEEPLILVTQADIRQVQLAKGAILSGFVALLRKAGIDMKDLDTVLIAGQFGAHLPVDSLTGVGILPKLVEDKIVYVGNSSKTGAYMCLMSEKIKKEMEDLARKINYVELAVTEGYEDIFRECMNF